MFEVGKPFDHAKVAKETAIVMHNKVTMEAAESTVFLVLREHITEFYDKIE